MHLESLSREVGYDREKSFYKPGDRTKEEKYPAIEWCHEESNLLRNGDTDNFWNNLADKEDNNTRNNLNDRDDLFMGEYRRFCIVNCEKCRYR